MNQFKKFAKIAGLLFAFTGATAFLLYFGMKALNGQSPIVVFLPFAPLHIKPYHDQYPVPYLLASALVFAVVSALWLVLIAPRLTRLRLLQIILLPWVALLFAGPVWGMLWVYHDMQAGFFPAFPQMIDYLLFGARQGLYFTLDVVMFSLPLNLLAYGAACLLLLMFVKHFVSGQPERVQMRSP
jgi:hypothetical protein